MRRLSRADEKVIRELVAQYLESRALFKVLLEQLSVAIQASQPLVPLIHSIKGRLKDPDHLERKLRRKFAEFRAKSKTGSLPVNRNNVFRRVNDLAGLRILHLHTHQFAEIDRNLRIVFNEYRYRIVEGPSARTWDDESRAYFRSIGVAARRSPSMYTSVHYIIDSGNKTKSTCELQVRTLAEELWGEVDHALNYPEPSPSDSCKEQIKVLARATSGCTRLVDCIFRTDADYKRRARVS